MTDIPRTIRQTLFQFNLTETEISLYLGLLQKGSSTVQSLSRFTKIKRTTAHVNLGSLIEKGLATELQRGNRREITAEPPEKLKHLLNIKKFELEKVQKELDKTIKSIHSLAPKIEQNTTATVKVIKGRDEINRLYEIILRSDEIRAYVNPEDIAKIFPENFTRFIKAASKGTKIRDLNTWSPIGREFVEKVEEIENYEMKLFPKSFQLKPMDYIIYDNCIAIIYMNNLNAIIIKNELIYENAVMLFDLMWDML